MEKYILQILENNSRVIVPEFGAFIIKQKNPLNIVFNEFLQYNDGVLVDTVAKSEGIDRDSAKKLIDDFVKEINQKLDKGNPYMIDQLGALIKSSTGKISLEKSPPEKSEKGTETKLTEKKPTQEKSVKETEKTKPETKEETDTKSQSEETKQEAEQPPKETEKKVEEKPKVELESTKEVPPVKENEKKEVPQSSAKVTHDRKTSQEKTSKAEKVPTNEETIPKKVTTPMSTPSGRADAGLRSRARFSARTAVPAEESKKKTNIWLWVIIILIVNGIIITYFIMSDQLSGLFKKSEEATTPEFYDMTPEAEEEKPDEMLIIEPEKPAIEVAPVKTTPKPQTSITGKRYYVVAGVFREEQNADNLVTELQNQGYNAEKFGKIGNLYAVSFGVYSSREEAEREMRRIKKEVNPEAWIKVMQ